VDTADHVLDIVVTPERQWEWKDARRCDMITWTHRTHPETWWAGPADGLGAAGTLLRRQTQP